MNLCGLRKGVKGWKEGRKGRKEEWKPPSRQFAIRYSDKRDPESEDEVSWGWRRLRTGGLGGAGAGVADASRQLVGCSYSFSITGWLCLGVLWSCSLNWVPRLLRCWDEMKHSGEDIGKTLARQNDCSRVWTLRNSELDFLRSLNFSRIDFQSRVSNGNEVRYCKHKNRGSWKLLGVKHSILSQYWLPILPDMLNSDLSTSGHSQEYSQSGRIANK